MTAKTLLSTMIVAATTALGSQATAQAYLEQPVSAEILPGWRQADGRHVAGLRFVLKDGWKTYWRSPGDGGIPPMFTWKGSRNLGDVEVIWPTPDVFDQSGMRSLGYSGEVVVPIVITPKRDAKDVALKGKLQIGVCEEICIPETLNVTGALTPSVTKVDPRIAAALAEQPYTRDEANVSSAVCEIAPSDYGMRVSATITMPSAGGAEFGVIETTNPQLWVAEANTRRNGNRLTLVSEIMHVDDAPVVLNRSDLRFTVIGASYAVDVIGCSGR